MKHLFYSVVFISGLILLNPSFLAGQTQISAVKYDSLKSLGLINNRLAYQITPKPSALNFKSSGYLPPDSTFQLAIPPSDDGSSALINLPFDFCFWGNPENTVYINNNGNISFGGLFTSSTPFDLPFSGFKVIAPFWSDVDTRVRGGVFYKVLPNALIVNWEDVGHFDQNKARGNSYQLIISDGTSGLLPFGYTVGFFYSKLEWTAGDASGGVGGFGGAPAIIGINNGDGVRYSLAGKFDKSDSTFDASVDSLNGVEGLVDQHVFLNPCDSLNNKPGLMGYKLSDTIGVCIGDTLDEEYRFLPPEFDQNAYVLVNSSSFPGFTVSQTTTGKMATARLEIIGSIANMGFHTVSFKVVDNGSPQQIINFDLVVQVDSLPAPLAILGDSIICNYDTTLLQVADIYDRYLWNTGSIEPEIAATPGSYELLVSANNCEAKQSFQVIGYLPSAIIAGPKFICNPSVVNLKAIGGYDQYQWSNGDTASSIFVSAGGDYFLTVTNNGCVDSSSISVEEDIFVKIATSNINSCNGDSVTLSVPNDYDQLVWSTGDTGQNITVAAGTYSITATVFSLGGMTCVVSDSIVIGTANIIPVQVSGTSFICGSGATQYEVIGIYDTYYWDNDGSQRTNLYENSGFHSVTVTSGTCIDTLGFFIDAIPIPSIDINGPLFYCDVVDSARLIATGGIWDSLIWNTGAKTDTIYTGFGWKKVTVWKDGCSNFDWHPVNELINGVDVKGITEVCPGQATRLDVEFGFDLYQWSNGGLGFSTLVSAPGDYWCVVHLDSCSAATDTITVTMNDPDTVQIFGDTVMCDSAGGVLFADLGYTQFQWSTGSRDPSISYTSPGVYSVTVQDAGFCVTSDTIDVVQKPSINPVIGGDSHYCFQDSTVLSVGVFNTYLWSNGAVSPSLKARAGNYSVTVSNSDGCIGTDQNFRVTQSSPEANIFIEEEVCADEVLTLYTRVGDQESILWGTGEVSDTIYSIPSKISLRITDRDNCQADSVKEFLALPSPEAGIEMSPISYSEAYLPVNFNDASDLNGSNIVSWFWQVNDSIIGNSEDTSITFYEGALLDVIHALVSDEGCTDTIRINYRITDDIVKVNIITPNGDGVNDFLVFPNIQKYPNNELFIYNRWGVEIAHYSGYYNHWDGYGLPEGTYFYVLELEEGVHPVKGSFTLLR